MWTELAREAISGHGDPLAVLRQMSFIISQLAETIAEEAAGIWTASTAALGPRRRRRRRPRTLILTLASPMDHPPRRS